MKLMLAMGYAGSREEAGEALGKGADEGVDGLINEDRLGLDVIYLQAKRYGGTVGRPAVQAFVGALEMKRARKGVLLITGTFTAEALSYIERIEKRVVLIDVQQLATLQLGCRERRACIRLRTSSEGGRP